MGKSSGAKINDQNQSKLLKASKLSKKRYTT
jgi:hypothetical protein